MAKFLSNRDGGKLDEEGIYQFLDKVFTGEVITGLNVTQMDTPGLGVEVQLGTAMIPSGSNYPYVVFADASENVTLATADGSNPRIDLIVGYVDLSVVSSTNPNNPGAFLLENITGTPSGSPAVPNAAAIQAVIGASNPYIILARVAVAASATTITNANVTDVRSMTGLSARNPAALFDFVESGCVWSGDSYGSNRNGSMTAGVVWINGKRLTVAAITAHTFTASKDTYVDLKDNGDGTATPVYSESTNNAASQALTSGNIRIAIIVTGASNIANVGSVNQGQEDKVLPIASSVPYAVTDSLGNLICPRDPMRRTLGYRQLVASVGPTATSTSDVDIVGLSVPVIVPQGRKIKITLDLPDYEQTGGIDSIYGVAKIKESTTVFQSAGVTPSAANLPNAVITTTNISPTTGLHTYKAATANNSTGPNYTIGASSVSIASIKVELV